MLTAAWRRRPARLRFWSRSTTRAVGTRRQGRLRSALLGLVVIGYGVMKCLTRDAMTYPNYFGGQVFAPVVVLAGVIAVIGAFLGREPKPLTDRRGRPLRLPSDEFDRPWTPVGATRCLGARRKT
jgi:hypothetical protein